MAVMPSPPTLGEAPATRRRIPAAERREALIEAAVHEFAHGGLHGTAVDRIARRVGVAQPYVFSLFGSKRDLFLAAVERCFEATMALFARTAGEFDPEAVPPEVDLMKFLGQAYVAQLETNRDHLMLQLQAYAACDDDVIRDRVRSLYARLVANVQAVTGTDQERLDDFFRYGMWLNVAAAMGVADLSVGCDWVQAELQPQDAGRRSG